MDDLTVYPDNKEQLTALKAIMKAMKVTVEQKNETYPDRVIDEVKDSVSQTLKSSLCLIQV